MTEEGLFATQAKERLWSKDTIRLMRIPFSYFLMPVFLFAVTQVPGLDIARLVICFVVLHIFIYPASNGYNSYMDRDEGSIGGLKNPPRPTRRLFQMSLLFDVMGLMLAWVAGQGFFLCILAYILASRAYSYKGIRLKKYALGGLLTIVFFQGAFTFWMVYLGITGVPMAVNKYAALVLCASSMLIAGFYPLTQIYQHDEDKKNGDLTISYKLGYIGTFVFTAVMFAAAELLLYFYFSFTGQQTNFLLFLIFSMPVVAYFIWWFMKVLRDRKQASFENTMRMNMLGATCLNLCFITFLIFKTFR